MAWRWLRPPAIARRGWWDATPRAPPFSAEQRATLVNVKPKWIKDEALDAAVSRERHLRAAHQLLDLVSSRPGHRVLRSDLIADRSVKKLFGSADAAFEFLGRFHTLFALHRAGVSLTDAGLDLRRREMECLCATEPDLVNRLRRLLMLTLPRKLPLHTVDLLRWDLGLPSDYRFSILRRYPDHFALEQPDGDERVWLRLLSWDDSLAVSELEKSADDGDTSCLPFPVSFTRGFNLSNKCMSWLQEWQELPYTSPYADPSSLDRRTDVSEKRNVGVFHELLHLTVAKRTERRNVSNMRNLLGMPQKFTKVFERHPGIFYISRVLDTQTVVLREAYGGGSKLLEKYAHPLAAIREEYSTMMKAALPPRTRGRKSHDASRESDKDEEEDDDEDQAPGYAKQLSELKQPRKNGQTDPKNCKISERKQTEGDKEREKMEDGKEDEESTGAGESLSDANQGATSKQHSDGKLKGTVEEIEMIIEADLTEESESISEEIHQEEEISALEKEKLEMKMLDELFEEKKAKIAAMMKKQKPQESDSSEDFMDEDNDLVLDSQMEKSEKKTTTTPDLLNLSSTSKLQVDKNIGVDQTLEMGSQLTDDKCDPVDDKNGDSKKEK